MNKAYVGQQCLLCLIKKNLHPKIYLKKDLDNLMIITLLALFYPKNEKFSSWQNKMENIFLQLTLI